MKKMLIIAVTAIFIANVTNAQDRMRIAVMDFNPGVGADASMVSGLSDMLINSLFDTRRFTIVERTQLDQVVREQGFQRTNLSAGEIARIGRILGVEYVLVGTVNVITTGRTLEQVKTGMRYAEYNLDVRIVSVESGEIVATAGMTRSGSQTYRSLMPRLAEDIVSRLSTPTEDNVVVLFGFLYVFPEDLGNLSFSEAQNIIRSINAGSLHGHNNWRMPTLEELQMIYQNRQRINGLSNMYYISSTSTSVWPNSDMRSGVNFHNGSTRAPNSGSDFASRGQVRLVRTNR
jgi:hypothetical protein